MDRKNYLLVIFFIVTILFWGVSIVFIALGSLPYNPLSLSNKNRLKITSVIPEGWAFFTRNPREANVFLYRKQENKIVSVDVANSSPSMFWGLKRNVRAQGVELEIIFNSINDTNWLKCNDDINKCLNWDTIPAIQVQNTTLIHSLCGELFLQKKEPVPWAWSKSREDIHMPAQVIKLNVICN